MVKIVFTNDGDLIYITKNYGKYIYGHKLTEDIVGSFRIKNDIIKHIYNCNNLNYKIVKYNNNTSINYESLKIRKNDIENTKYDFDENLYFIKNDNQILHSFILKQDIQLHIKDFVLSKLKDNIFRIKTKIKGTYEKGICNIDLEEYDYVFKTECGHTFLYENLMKWCQKSNTCPYCRTELKK
jgi:hypothetical protein